MIPSKYKFACTALTVGAVLYYAFATLVSRNRKVDAVGTAPAVNMQPMPRPLTSVAFPTRMDNGSHAKNSHPRSLREWLESRNANTVIDEKQATREWVAAVAMEYSLREGFEMLEEIGDQSTYEEATMRFISIWARESPDETIEFVLSLDSPRKADYLSAAGQSWKAGTLDDIVSLLEKLGSLDLQSSFLGGYSLAMAEEPDNLTILGNLLALGEKGVITEVNLDHAISIYVGRGGNIETLVSFLDFEKEQLSPLLKDGLNRNLISNLVKRDTKAAVKVFESFPLEEQRKHIGTFIGNWVKVDSLNSSNYVASIADTRMRDFAAYCLAIRLPASLREESVIWAESITDTTMKTKALEYLEGSNR